MTQQYAERSSVYSVWQSSKQTWRSMALCSTISASGAERRRASKAARGMTRSLQARPQVASAVRRRWRKKSLSPMRLPAWYSKVLHDRVGSLGLYRTIMKTG